MATEYTLRRADGRPFGSFDQVQAIIRQLFPTVEFFWTESGPEKVRRAEANGVELPPHIREWMVGRPAVFEGVAEGPDFHVTFGLGTKEPVACLFVEPRGLSPELDRGLAALEAEAGAGLRVSGSE